MKNRLYIVLFVVFTSGCAAIVGDAKDRPGVITQYDAANIARNYINNKNLGWGEPWLFRNTFETFVFTFSTPEREMTMLGERMMYVNKKTGEVTFPPRM